jgi:SAM-dependent methyltransferase
MSDDTALALIDVSSMRGLEIGALNHPRVRREQGQIFYVDHYSTEELRERYLANEMMRTQLDTIVDVDFVIRDGKSLADAVGGTAPFDYVIGSHLIEHVPNPIGWLHEVASILERGGILSLVVPDRRFTFDCNRVETQMRDWIDWHFRDLQVPTYTQVYDFFANVVTIDGMVDTAGLWAGTVSYADVRRADVADADVAAFEICTQHRNAGRYIDVHGAVYTPVSFLALLEITTRLGLLDFELAHFESTAVDQLEFFVSLRRVASPADGIAVRADAFRRCIEHERRRMQEVDPERVGAREATLGADLVAERQRREQAEAALAALTASRSWRVTAPLRSAARAARQLRQRRRS